VKTPEVGGAAQVEPLGDLLVPAVGIAVAALEQLPEQLIPPVLPAA